MIQPPVPGGWRGVLAAMSQRKGSQVVLGSTVVCRRQVGRAPPNGCRKCPCRHGENQSPPACLRDSSRTADGPARLLSNDCLCLRFGACAILCVSFKSGVSASCCPLALLKVSPAGLQSQVFWGLVFFEQDSWGWGA